MTSPPRNVLVVDDSAIIRRMLTKAVATGDGLTAESSPSAPIAIKRIARGGVDLVLLDVEMPEMDGIEAVSRIREKWPRLPVVMCSALTERGGLVTLRALEAGATDYIAKPSSSSGSTLEQFHAELLAKVRALLPSEAPRPAFTVPKARRRVAPSPATTLQTRVDILAIASSTGGPRALAQVFEALPGALPVPIVIVQHMPPVFTRLLAERLGSFPGQTAKEGEDGEPLVAGTTYVAPGGRHMIVGKGDNGLNRIRLHDGPLEQSCRPAADVLFRSVAEVYGPNALACVFTGMGHDGTAGSEVLVEHGGVVVVQDRATCVVPSMPMSVESRGLAQAVLPLPSIANELYQRTATRVAARPRPARTG